LILLALILLALTMLAACAGSPSLESPTRTEEGVGSYYAHKFEGRLTASGEVYHENELTAAHRTLPFGTLVRVTNTANGSNVLVRVNDRGPWVEGRIIDVSYRAAEELGFVKEGLARLRVEVVGASP
jgi:rare lipoprotein A